MVTLLMMVTVLALLVATVASDSLQTLMTANQSGRDSQAKYAAYAGMEMVMNDLRKNEKYHGEETIDTRHGRTVGELGVLSDISYDVLVWNNMQDNSSSGSSSSEGSTTTADILDGPGEIKVQPDTVYMVATGRDSVKGQDVVLSRMAGTARRIRPVFEDAAYGRSKIIVEGDTLIDAWDSQGGWTDYVPGKFPESNDSNSQGGGNQGGGENEPTPTVSDFEATIGTDNKSGRTMRLLGDAKINGYFRVGPGISQAFTTDSGSFSGTSDDGDSMVSYGVATATSPETQIAGQKDITGDDRFAKVDDKKTDMPRFVAPYDADDLSPAPTVNNASSEKEEWRDGQKVKVYVPPAPVPLAPGGYESVSVPGDQTLELSPGVYYFQKGMNVSGKVKLTGSDPVIVFVGEKAVFSGAEINPHGKTSQLQLCFTDELKEKTEIDALVERVGKFFDTPSSADPESPLPPTNSESYVHNILSPVADPEDPESREGASLLEINGGTFRGSISGKNLVTLANGAEVFGGMMANIINFKGGAIHQDLALKGSNLMNAGGWALEGVHQVR